MIDYLEKNRKFAVLFTILIAVEIFVVSSISGSKTVSSGPDLSTAYHLLVFFLLNFFAMLSVTKKKNKNMRYLILPTVISLLYAVLDEVHQMLVPLRSASVEDVLIDIAGILLSVAVYVYYKRKSKRA